VEVLIGIQARTASSRLPGKIYKEIGDKSILKWVYDRCNQGSVNNKYVKTKVSVLCSKFDKKLHSYCEENELEYFKDADCKESDLLGRYYAAAQEYCPDSIVRITSDCPTVNPELISIAVNMLAEYDYVTNTSPRTFVDGLDVQGISKEAFICNCGIYEEFASKFHAKALLNRDTLIINPFHPETKQSIDTMEDLLRARKNYERVAVKK